MDIKRLSRLSAVSLSYVILGGGIAIFVLNYLLNYTIPGIALAILFPAISSYLTFIYIVPAVVIIRFHLSERSKYQIVVIGLCVFLVFTSLLPIFAIPMAITNVENQIITNYGTDYTNLDTSSMVPRPFSLWNQFNGMPGVDSEIDILLNQEYHDNGQDKFYFDYYAPKTRPLNLPVIIKLHGGAWVLGNKGPIFNVPLSKYLAAQGYVVFDLQYGLFDIMRGAETAGLSLVASAFNSLLLTNPELKNKVLPDYNENYMIQDQVANIGEFTKFLYKNANVYDADINNVFVMGSSAGAHMASVVGIGYNNLKFSGVFDNRLTLRGTVLFYPPTDLKKMKSAMEEGRLGALPVLAPAFNTILDDGSLTPAQVEEEYEKYSAAYLIQEAGVEIAPIMVLHGNCDNLVPYVEQAAQFYDIARNNNRECIFITMPFLGHFFDGFNTQSCGWQVSTYFIERFIALEVS